jgi:cyclic pyranopterin phosphate synthase
MLAQLPQIEDISLTTNGLLLERSAEALVEAGLTRINVSLDTLLPHRYRAMTRRDGLARVLSGMEMAARFGLSPIKVNTVVLRDQNEDEVETLVDRARTSGWELRFIEYMPLENDDSWEIGRVVTGPELLERIGRRWPLDPDPSGDPHAPASRFLFRDGVGAIGFINSISQPFCGDCSRLRLTSDGCFRVCLYDQNEIDLKQPMRNRATDRDLERLMLDAVARKGRGGALEILENRGRTPLRRTMHQIGG